MRNKALFVSWCRPDLIRPRAVQVGRVAKGLAASGWTISLICATFDNESDLFDPQLMSLYGRAFAREKHFIDLQSCSPHGLRKYELTHAGPAPQSWSTTATAEIKRWIRFQRRPLVVSFAQPWDCHMAVLAAKLRHPRIRWVAHFSDPWAANPYLVYQPEDTRHRAAENERKVIEAADAIVFVTAMTAELTMRRYPPELQRKVVIIPHATDCALQKLATPDPPDSPVFRLTHTGALYSGRRSGDALYGALHELRAEAAFERSFQLRLVGEMPAPLEATIESFGLSQMVSVATPLYFLPSLTEMNRANALLVIDADLEPSPFLPSKIFDYLLFDRPIVALTPRGSVTDRFLRELGYETAPPNDIAAVKCLLSDLVEKWRQGELRISAEHKAARREFDLMNVAKYYVELFRRV